LPFIYIAPGVVLANRASSDRVVNNSRAPARPAAARLAIAEPGEVVRPAAPRVFGYSATRSNASTLDVVSPAPSIASGGAHRAVPSLLQIFRIHSAAVRNSSATKDPGRRIQDRSRGQRQRRNSRQHIVGCMTARCRGASSRRRHRGPTHWARRED